MGYERGLNDARKNAAEASLKEHQQKLAELEQMSAAELYRNTAGEIEARDAASRIDMTAEERLDKWYEENYEAYSKDNFFEHIKSIVETDNLLYANKNKTSKLLSDSELYLLTRYNNLRFDTIIHQSKNVVKTNSENKQMDLDTGTDSNVKKSRKKISDDTTTEDGENVS